MTNQLKFHFIGIKGSGMSALAQILHDQGHDVKGTDVDTFFFTQEGLQNRNIPFSSFSSQSIEEDRIVIGGNAFSEEHPEIQEAKEKQLSFFRYHEYLTSLINEHTSIGVSGAHGKTSTTGLLSHVLNYYHPTSYLIGDGTGFGKQNSSHFAFEACEYRRHFLAYHPDYAVITNIDFDHPDYFSSLEDVKEAFVTFANQAKKGVVLCGDDEHCMSLVTKTPKLTYGFKEHNDIRATNVKTETFGMSFDLFINQTFIDTIEIPVFGKHNVLNALSVIGICFFDGVDIAQLNNAFSNYKGVKRRFSETTIGTNIMIDDYAHHPTEIAATIDTVRNKYPNKHIVAIFQPHTFSRTKTFLQDFANSLSLADTVFLCDIFGSAREKNGELSIHDLLSLTQNSHFISKETLSQLLQFENSVLLFMGAGDVQKLEKSYEELFHSHEN